MSESATALAGVGGIGFVVDCMRVTQASATFFDGSVTEGAVKSSRVRSDIGAPPAGLLPWQLWQLVWRTSCTSQGIPEVDPPPLPPIGCAVVATVPLHAITRETKEATARAPFQSRRVTSVVRQGEVTSYLDLASSTRLPNRRPWCRRVVRR
jgi:hypothetical protein